MIFLKLKHNYRQRKSSFFQTPFPSSTRSSESHDGQTIEANTLKRHYQGTLVSGFWFYFMQIYKMFTVMSFWRFINKTKTMTNCQCQLYFFGAAFLASHIGSGLFFSNFDLILCFFNIKVHKNNPLPHPKIPIRRPLPI